MQRVSVHIWVRQVRETWQGSAGPVTVLGAGPSCLRISSLMPHDACVSSPEVGFPLTPCERTERNLLNLLRPQEGLDLDTALAQVRAARPITYPNQVGRHV